MHCDNKEKEVTNIVTANVGYVF